MDKRIEDMPSLHIFGIEKDGEVVCEVHVKPNYDKETLDISVRRDPGVKIAVMVDIFVECGLSLRRLVRNEHLLALVERETKEAIERGESPF